MPSSLHCFLVTIHIAIINNVSVTTGNRKRATSPLDKHMMCSPIPSTYNQPSPNEEQCCLELSLTNCPRSLFVIPQIDHASTLEIPKNCVSVSESAICHSS